MGFTSGINVNPLSRLTKINIDDYGTIEAIQLEIAVLFAATTFCCFLENLFLIALTQI